MHALPVSKQDRIQLLDVLRGFALLGILLDNIFGFSGWGFMTESQRAALPTWTADGALGLIELAFIKGKFYSLFSLLFGIGFSIILFRNQQKSVNAIKLFYRRLSVLLLIGAFHLYFLWDGDILFLYALLGFLLPLFRKCSDRSLLIWASALILSPVLIDVVQVLLNIRMGSFLQSMAHSMDKQNGVPLDDTSAQYLYLNNAGWNEWRNWQKAGFLYRYAYLIESNRLPKVLGMFLIGFWAGRKMIYAKPADYVGLFKSIRKWGFIIGIPANLAIAWFEIDNKHIPNAWGLLDTFFYAVGVVPLSLAYVASICLFWVRTKGDNNWKVLAPVGRMALTNYLMQTILCIIIFYGVGFGLGGNMGPVVFWPIAFVIYSLQVIYSNWWFNYFEYGPVEWIWRQLTYGKRLNLKKKADKTIVAATT